MSGRGLRVTLAADLALGAVPLLVVQATVGARGSWDPSILFCLAVPGAFVVASSAALVALRRAASSTPAGALSADDVAAQAEAAGAAPTQVELETGETGAAPHVPPAEGTGEWS